MSWIDHSFCVLFVLIAPLYSVWGYRRLRRRIAAGVAGARMQEYAESTVLLWLFGLGALAVWLGQGRAAAEIGLALPGGWGVLPSLAIVAAVVWFLSRQLVRVQRMPERPVVGAEGIESVEALLPATRQELAAFVVVALSAGVYEEILYRGYLIAYLESAMPLWAAAILSSLAFAYGHLYQGMANLPRIFLLALAFAGIYLWTGSLLLPMVLHAFIDINSVLTARAVLAKPEKP